MPHHNDFLDLIEDLPEEVCEMLENLRELDMDVARQSDILDQRVNALFQQCRRGKISSSMADSEFDSIRTSYSLVLEDSDKKIELVSQKRDLVQLCLSNLDTELCKYEKDNGSSTEVLNQPSLPLDTTMANGGADDKKNRFDDTQSDSHYKAEAEKCPNSEDTSVSCGAIKKQPETGSSQPLDNISVRVQDKLLQVVSQGVVAHNELEVRNQMEKNAGESHTSDTS